MPTNLSDFVGGGKPKLITPYTTGTGTYIPTAHMARCFVRIQGGGGGGAGSGGYAGGGGAMVEAWVRIPITGWGYVIGAGGGSTVNGSPTTFGPYIAQGGFAGGSVAGVGGLVGNSGGFVDADSATVSSGGAMGGVSGGGGGYSAITSGFPAGFPIPYTSPLNTASMYAYCPSNGRGLGSGGDSFFGKGGLPGASAAADQYGAGAGYGGSSSGAGGYIEIWDFGA